MWTDTSSYSQDDTKRVPRCWEWCRNGLRITVHRYVGHPPDAWLLTCYQLAIDRHELRHTELCRAQAEALRTVHETAQRYADATRPA